VGARVGVFLFLPWKIQPPVGSAGGSLGSGSSLLFFPGVAKGLEVASQDALWDPSRAWRSKGALMFAEGVQADPSSFSECNLDLEPVTDFGRSAIS
jgi:hypothetical protein